MVAFYNQADQDIYNSGSKFVPQERYRLGYTPPVIAPTAAPVSGGITNTNAFTNSGGNSFNQSGNAFGYGSPVEEVNVRTFNPQPYNPTGGSPFSPSFDPMANRESYGAQGQYTSPYDDTVDLGYLGRDTTTSLEGTVGKDGIRRVSKLGKIMNMLPSVTNLIKSGAKIFQDKFPNPNGPGGGTYGIAGLSDDKKAAYNALSGGNMLFDGQQGFKTLTGKNFQAKDYIQGQMDLAKSFGFDNMTEKEIEDEIEKEKMSQLSKKFGGTGKYNNPGFKYKQMLESSKIYQTNAAQEKNKENMANLAAAESRRESARQYDPAVHGPTNYGLGSDGNQSYDSGNQGFGTNATSGGPVSNKTGRGRTDYMEGGRAGYFFGGRVNFKDGGLASIL